MLLMKITVILCESSQVTATRPNPEQLGFIKGTSDFSCSYLLILGI